VGIKTNKKKKKPFTKKETGGKRDAALNPEGMG